MAILMQGIIHVTGEHDTGKTTFALECGASPDRICLIDDDVKGRGTIEQLTNQGIKFGAYHDFVSLTRGKTEVGTHKVGLEIIESLGHNQYDALIWDTWTRFGKSCHSIVVGSPNKFRVNWVKKGNIKGAQQWQEAAQYEAALVAAIKEKIPLVILVTHLRDGYLNNAKTGKMIPAASKTISRVASLRIWLRHNPSSPVPIGLLLKRLDAKRVTERGIRTTCITPRKIAPSEIDESLWDVIIRYMETPIANRELTPEETPNEYELSILDDTLTEDQKLAWRVGLQEMAFENGERLLGQAKPVSIQSLISEISESSAEKVKELSGAGKSNREIAKSTGLKIRQVITILKG